MNKIVNFFKKYYIASTIVLALLLIILSYFIIIKLLNNYKVVPSTKTSSYYQYFDTVKNKFKLKVEYENDQVVNINAKNYSISNTNIIYDSKSESIILPFESEIVFYYQDCDAYKLNVYTSVKKTGNSNKIYNNSAVESESDFFIYNGENLYFLPVQSTLHLNGDEIQLSEYSYILIDNEYVIYYNYETDNIVKEENYNNVYLELKSISIDLYNAMVNYNGKRSSLPKTFKYLNIYGGQNNE